MSKRDEALDKYTVDLTAEARDGKIDPIIGRKDIILSVARVMIRRRKNSAILIRELETGKTVIAEGLAYHIEGNISSTTTV